MKLKIILGFQLKIKEKIMDKVREEFEKWAKTIDCRITIIDVKNKTKKVFK